MSTTPWLCSASLLIACAGCWQEVQYNPNDSQVVSLDRNSHTEESAVAAKAEIPPKPSPAAADVPESDRVTADELFGSPAETASSPPATPSSIPPDADSEPALTNEESHSTSAVAEPAIEPAPEVASPPAEVEGHTAEKSPPSLEGADVTIHAENPGGEIMRPSRTALAVWQMSSSWSFAAAVYAKGQPEERYQDSLDQATYAAKLVGLELPSFPASEGMALEAAVITYLLGTGPEEFVNRLGEDYVPEYEALAELAIRTNALLLVYTPKSQQLDPLISSIRQAAENSGLPQELWTHLLSMLDRREPFADVKHRVLSFHTEVGDYLAGQK